MYLGVRRSIHPIVDWIGLILFRLGHPLSHWLLFRGPSNQKYTINKQQTNKHTTLLIVISNKCSIMQCSVLLVAVVGLLHSSLLMVAGGCREKRPETPSLGLDLSPSHNSALQSHQ